MGDVSEQATRYLRGLAVGYLLHRYLERAAAAAAAAAEQQAIYDREFRGIVAAYDG